MEDKYKLLNEDYSKILDLVGLVDEKLLNKYKNLIDKLPPYINTFFEMKELFYLIIKNLMINLSVVENTLMFKYTNTENYFQLSIYFDLFNQNDLDSEETIYIFDLKQTNTRTEPSVIRIEYEQNEDGELNHVQSVNDGVEISYNVFIRKLDDMYFLVSKKYINGQEIYSNVEPITYDCLLKYASENKIDYDNGMINN